MAAGRTLIRRYTLTLTPTGAGVEAAVTAAPVPPLGGGPCSHGSAAAHAFTIVVEVDLSHCRARCPRLLHCLLVDDVLPLLVRQAVHQAHQAGFSYSCDPEVGRLLAVLAGHLPAGARVLELGTGTGTGVGTAWITSGLLPRTDVTVITVEKDPAIAVLAAGGDWPAFVDLRCADALTVLASEPGGFDLIFADAPGGKWEGLDRTIAALAPHGLLIVDDMIATTQWDAGQHTRQREVRQALLASPLLTTVELEHGSGVILSTRRAVREARPRAYRAFG